MRLTHGAWSAEFDASTAALRYIRYGDVEVLRAVYAAVRDADWGTVPAVVTDVAVAHEPDATILSYTARCRRGEIDFEWRGQFAWHGPTTLQCTFDGRALSTFWRNRIGFCVLHPAELAGMACTAHTAAGRTTPGRLPVDIAPHQPFVRLAGFDCALPGGGECAIAYGGDDFEMEDQRNWTDASFKTYCTPLARPFPVHIDAGTEVRQTVTVEIRGRPATDAAAAADDIVDMPDRGAVWGPLPSIGLRYHPQTDIDALRRITLGHLAIELDLRQPAWREALRAAAACARRVGAVDAAGRPMLEISLATALQPDGWRGQVEAFRRDEPLGAGWWLLSADRVTPAAADDVTWLAALVGAGRVGAATRANFAELNRHRPAPGVGGLVAFAVNPQVHATDERHMVETLAMQAACVESARRFAGGRAIVVAPVTLAPTFNAVATSPGAAVAEAPPDPRQSADFGAAWLVGSLAALSAAGAAAVTYFATGGPGGVAPADRAPTPALAALEAITAFAADAACELPSPHPVTARGLLLRHGHRQRVVLAMYDRRPVRLPWDSPGRWVVGSGAAHPEAGGQIVHSTACGVFVCDRDTPRSIR